MKGIQGSPNSLVMVVLDDRIALDFLSVGHQGKVCTTANSSCCAWISSASIAERSRQRHKEKATWLSKVTLMVAGICSEGLVWNPGEQGWDQYCGLASSCYLEASNEMHYEVKWMGLVPVSVIWIHQSGQIERHIHGEIYQKLSQCRNFRWISLGDNTP